MSAPKYQVGTALAAARAIADDYSRRNECCGRPPETYRSPFDGSVIDNAVMVPVKLLNNLEMAITSLQLQVEVIHSDLCVCPGCCHRKENKQ